LRLWKWPGHLRQDDVDAADRGNSGDEVVQAFLGVMAAGVPYTVISRGMYIHPTVAEYLPTLLSDLTPLGRIIYQDGCHASSATARNRDRARGPASQPFRANQAFASAISARSGSAASPSAANRVK
jgi:hypothetical protein